MIRRRGGLFLVLIALPLTIVYCLFARYRTRVIPVLPVTTIATGPLSRDQKVLVVASVKGANTKWVHEDVPGWTPAIYVADDPTAPLHPKENKGREANIFLTYIIDHYDRLPEVMAFVHEHRWAYHVDKAFATNPESINLLNTDHVQRVGYQSLHCFQRPAECRSVVGTMFNFADWDVERHWKDLFPNGGPFPSVISAPQFAQFAVSKAQVLARPKSDYQRMHDWLMSTDDMGQKSGRVFEHVWHIIFGRPAEFCVLRPKCLCDAFGFCDEDDPEVQKAIKGDRHLNDDGTPKGYHEWKELRDKEGLESTVFVYVAEELWQNPGMVKEIKQNAPELFYAQTVGLGSFL